MSAEFIWTLPTRGDGRRARRDEWNRGDWHAGLPTSPEWVHDARRGTFDPFDHLERVILAVDHSGFDGLLVPYDVGGEESWIVATVAARATRWSRTIVEFSPHVTTPVYAAKLSTTFQRVANGRLDWKLAVDLDDATAAAQGDTLRGNERYERADEFLTIARTVWREQGFDFEGRYYAVDSGGFGEPLNVHAFPRVFLSGSSPEALHLAAKHADIHVLDAKDDAALDDDIARLRALATETGRSVRIGLSLPVITREDSDEAWARVRRLVDERASGSFEDIKALRLGSVLWAGFERIGFSKPVGLVGSYEEVHTQLEAYVNRGIDLFVFDGYPHIEEIYRIGQHLLPLGASTSASVAP